MREACRGLNLRKIILISILLGTLFGNINIVGAWDDVPPMNEPLEWKCAPAGVIECTTNGCRKSSNQPDSFWVCNYSGVNCPPLEACENR